MQKHFFRPRSLRLLAVGTVFSLFTFPLTACTENNDYASLISEARREIYLAETDGFSLTANFGEREYPYAADGKAETTSPYGEVCLIVPDNGAEYTLSFSINGKKYGGEMSFDSVEGRFYFSQSLPVPSEGELIFTVAKEGEEHVLHAARVKTGKELSPEDAVRLLCERRKEQWKNRKIGEVYVRLTHSGENYYFIAVIDVSGVADYFLLNAENGDIVTERTNG